MAAITVGFGPANSVTREYDTVEDLLADSAMFQFLGASQQNVDVRLANGTNVTSGPFEHDQSVQLVTKANSKS